MKKFLRDDLWLHKTYHKDIYIPQYEFCLVNKNTNKAYFITSDEVYDIDKNDLHESGLRTEQDIDQIERQNSFANFHDAAAVYVDPNIDHLERGFFYANYVKLHYNNRLINKIEQYKELNAEILQKPILTEVELKSYEDVVNKWYYEALERAAKKTEKDNKTTDTNITEAQAKEARNSYPQGFNDGAELTLKTK